MEQNVAIGIKPFISWDYFMRAKTLKEVFLETIWFEQPPQVKFLLKTHILLSYNTKRL